MKGIKIIAFVPVLLLLVGCLVSITPDQHGLVVATPAGTNAVSNTQITGAVTGLFAALGGSPEIGALIGSAIIGAIWAWRAIRAKRAKRKVRK